VRPLSESWPWRRAAEPALAGAAARLRAQPVLLRGERARMNALPFGLSLDRPPPRGVGAMLAISLFIGVAAVGFVRGGHYQAFVEAEGGVCDFLARAFGFEVKSITLSGQSRLTPAEVLAIAGVSPKISTPFFDVDLAREKLEETPLIKQASVRKLYPSQIFIELVERTPAALWQKDGEVRTIAADGAVIDELRNERADDLPFVVGAGANERLPEFRALIGSAEELKPKISAGVLVDQRRWNLRLRSGVDVKLPETDPGAAIATLLKLQRESRLLDREILWVDLRTPGKAFVRLSAEAAAARAEARPKKGGAP
jgi:cell division protein FtsQ